MTRANRIHSFQGLMRSFIAIDHSSQFAGNVSHLNRLWITPQDNDTSQNISFRKDAKKFAFVIDHANSPDVFQRHKLSSVLNRGRGVHRVRLAIANNVSDEHHYGKTSNLSQ